MAAWHLEGEPEEAIIAIKELLAVVAMVAHRWTNWRGKLVLAVVDNVNVVFWNQGWQAGNRAARLLLRILRRFMARGGFRIYATFTRTYHNVTADFITRAEEGELRKRMQEMGL